MLVNQMVLAAVAHRVLRQDHLQDPRQDLTKGKWIKGPGGTACLNGGTAVGIQPNCTCDCSGTGFGGSNCQTPGGGPVCPSGENDFQRKVVAGAYRPISMGSVKLGIWQVHSEIMLIVKKRGTLVGSGLRQVCVFL